MTTLEEYKAHRKELKQQIKELKAELHRLEVELEQERCDMQHDEVDHLDDYMHQAEPHFKDLKRLSLVAMEDLRKAVGQLMGAGKRK